MKSSSNSKTRTRSYLLDARPSGKENVTQLSSLIVKNLLINSNRPKHSNCVGTRSNTHSRSNSLSTGKRKGGHKSPPAQHNKMLSERNGNPIMFIEQEAVLNMTNTNASNMIEQPVST